MAERERISRPTSGSNEVGEVTEEIRGTGMLAGTDTQTHIAALDSKLKKDHTNVTNENVNRERTNFPDASEMNE